MSAFIVEEQTINRVISWLQHGPDSSWYRRTIKDEQGADLDTDEGQQDLANSMHALNISAVEQRYNTKSSSNGYFRYRYGVCERMQAYKSLRCWLYQCSEGDVPDTSLLFATMERIADAMAQEIIRALPEWDAAEWG